MKNRDIGEEEVREKFGVGPDKVVDVQALAGDSSDNVPGVPGIGVKTAAELINTYGDLDTILERAGEIKQPKRRENLIEHADLARLSRELVRLRDDVEVDGSIEDFGLKEPDPAVLLPFLKAQEFGKLYDRMAARLGGNGATAAAEAPPAAAIPEPAAPEALDTPASYETVTDMAALDAWIARAEAAGIVAVDTETTSLDAMRAELVGVCLSVVPGEACYIPLGHRAPADQGAFDLGDGGMATPSQHNGSGGLLAGQIGREEALARLTPLFENPGVMKVLQNAKYDMLVLARHGVRLAPVDDTMLLSYALSAGLGGHGLDDLSLKHLGHSNIPFKEVVGSGKSRITFDLVPLDKATDYAAEDADMTMGLYNLLKPQLQSRKLVTLYETLERPLVPVLVDMEQHGIKVDAKILAGLSKDFTARLGELEVEIHKLAGREFNVGSPKQLGEVLFDEMNLPGAKKGKSGAYSTGAEVLEELAAQGHDLPARVLGWRQLDKLKNTYTEALQGQINPDTGRVHTSYSMAATSTGRLASTDPNLQNIPIRTEEGRKIRQAFVPEKGHKLLSADYSQIELRLLAHIADIPALKDAFQNGEDIHAMTASEIFGVPQEGMDPMVRRQAKAINFGIIYGISAFGLARQLGISRGEAKAFIDTYFERFPGIRDYMDRTKDECREQGFVKTLFGRQCHMRGINDKNPNMRAFAERAAINAPIQGSAADVIRRAMIRMGPALDGAGLSAKMLLQVHDELIFEVPKAELEYTAALVARVMEGAAHPAVEISVALTVDTGHGDNWDQAH